MLHQFFRRFGWLVLGGAAAALALAPLAARERPEVQSRRDNEVKVSWQVTGVRHDADANAHRIRVVTEKPAADQGKYLFPRLYGKPRSR